MEKKEKEIEAKMEALAKEKKHHGKGGKHGKSGAGKKGGGGKGKGKMDLMGYGGSLFGGIVGRPTGSTMSSMFSGGGAGRSSSSSSDSIEMQKLEQMMQEMNKIFTMVDNMLKSMNDVVKQGPLASIRG